MQTSLPPELAPTGSSNLLMFVSTSCSIFLALGQLAFQQRLNTNLSAVVSPSVAQKVISAGATNFRSVLPASADVRATVDAYGKSVTQAFVRFPFENKPAMWPFANDIVHAVHPSCGTGDSILFSLWLPVDLY